MSTEYKDCLLALYTHADKRSREITAECDALAARIRELEDEMRNHDEAKCGIVRLVRALGDIELLRAIEDVGDAQEPKQ